MIKDRLFYICNVALMINNFLQSYYKKSLINVSLTKNHNLSKTSNSTLTSVHFQSDTSKKSSPNLNVYWSEVNPTLKSGKKFSSISPLSKACKNLSTPFLRKLRITSTVTQKVVSTSLMHLEKDFLNKKALRNSLLLLVVLLLMNTTQRKNSTTSE